MAGPFLIGSLARLRADARYAQILALSTLLVWNLATLSLGASALPSLAALAGTVLTQAALARAEGAPVDWRSPLITGLSLSLLLRTDALWLMAAAGAVAILSKRLLRWQGKHLFNPAAFAILVMILSGRGWVSPGQWGHSLVLVAAILGLGVLVLERARRLDLALGFSGTYALLLFARATVLGDPATIPLHQLDNGALVLFACFMITDPRTAPDGPLARLAFTALVASLAFWLIFGRQMQPGLYVALILGGLLVPVLDRLQPARRFTWRPPEGALR